MAMPARRRHRAPFALLLVLTFGLAVQAHASMIPGDARRAKVATLQTQYDATKTQVDTLQNTPVTTQEAADAANKQIDALIAKQRPRRCEELADLHQADQGLLREDVAAAAGPDSPLRSARSLRAHTRSARA